MQVDSCNVMRTNEEGPTKSWNKLLVPQVREYADLLKDS